MKWWLWLAVGVVLVRLVVMTGQMAAAPDALGWDGVQSWFYKAKVWHLAGWKGFSELVEDERLVVETDGVRENYTHPAYPPLVPLVVAGVYGLWGSENIFVAKLLWWGMAVAIWGIIYFRAKEKWGREGGWVVAAAVASLPVWVDHVGGKYAGYADLPLAFLMLLAVVALVDKREVLAVFLAGLAALTKLEGLGFLLGVMAISVWRSGWKKKLGLVVLGAVMVGWWYWWVVRAEWGGYWQMAGISGGLVEKLGVIVKGLLGGMGEWRTFLLFWSVAVGVFLWRRRVDVVLALVLFQVLGYVGGLLVTPYPVEAQVASTADRFLFQLVPLVGLAIVGETGEKRKNKSGKKGKISCVILTRNEGKNIKECIESVKWCDEVVVVDDNSLDRTREIARKMGARVIKRALRGNFAAQRNFGLRQAKGAWVFFVDADERVSDKLREEVERVVEKPEGKVGFYVRRMDVMWGRKLKHGETGTVRLLRLAKREAGKWTRRVDEVWQVEGEVGQLEAPLLHLPHQTVSEFLSEVNFKSGLNAKQFLSEGKRVGWWDWGKPVGKFLYDWIWLGGFRDGIEGFNVALMMSLHSFLVRGKMKLGLRKNRNF